MERHVTVLFMIINDLNYYAACTHLLPVEYVYKKLNFVQMGSNCITIQIAYILLHNTKTSLHCVCLSGSYFCISTAPGLQPSAPYVYTSLGKIHNLFMSLEFTFVTIAIQDNRIIRFKVGTA